jgi:hypothetical protein
MLELNEYKDSILKMIDEYIKFNSDFQKKYNMLHYIRAINFYFSQKSDHRFTIQFLVGDDPDLNKSYQYNSERSIMHKDYEDLKKFMEDPELYKATKNYNL